MITEVSQSLFLTNLAIQPPMHPFEMSIRNNFRKRVNRKFVSLFEVNQIQFSWLANDLSTQPKSIPAVLSLPQLVNLYNGTHNIQNNIQSISTSTTECSDLEKKKKNIKSLNLADQLLQKL